MNKALSYFLILILAIAVSIISIRSNFSTQTTSFLLFLLVFLPVLIKPDIGLVIIIISMLLSPEIIVGHTTARAVAIRAEDILLLAIVLAWFLKTAFTKDIMGAFNVKLAFPFFLYLLACIISTSFGIMAGEIDIKQSFFSILKYIEYFMLFIMARDSLKSMKQLKVFLIIFFVTALIVAAHSNAYIDQEISAGTAFFRVAPPVETRGGGEAGTLGGYLIFMMAIAAGLVLHVRGTAVRIALVALELVMFRAFLYTLSRGSYIAFVPMIITLIYFTKKNKLTLIYTVIVGVILVVVFAPHMVKDRVLTTLTSEADTSGTHLVWEASPAERWQSWKVVMFYRFPKSPLFGYGVARFFIDGQIFLTLCEVGLVGFCLLGWLLGRLFKMARSVLNVEVVKNDDFSAGLAIGFLAGFAGLLGHAIGSNTFIIIKIMEPFWFMAAMALSLPRLREEEEAAKAAAAAY